MSKSNTMKAKLVNNAKNYFICFKFHLYLTTEVQSQFGGEIIAKVTKCYVCENYALLKVLHAHLKLFGTQYAHTLYELLYMLPILKSLKNKLQSSVLNIQIATDN